MINNILLISLYTLNEAVKKKIIIVLLSLATLVIGVMFLASEFISQMIMSNPLPDETIKLEEVIIRLEFGAVYFVITFIYLLGIFSVSPILPSLMEKGVIDIFLSKPISRAELFFGRYIGSLLIFLITLFYIVTAIWIIGGVKFGVWDIRFFYILLFMLINFTALVSIISFVGVATNSSAIAMVFSYLILFVNGLLAKREIAFSFINSEAAKTIINIFYYILPKFEEIGSAPSDIVFSSKMPESVIIWSTLLFIAVVTFGGMAIFKKKDFS